MKRIAIAFLLLASVAHAQQQPALRPFNNLADVSSAATARANLLTLSGQDYIDLSGTVITALAIDPDNLSSTTGTGSVVLDSGPTLTIPVLTAPTVTGIVTWQDNVRQTFDPGANNAGLNVGAHTADGSTPTNGDVYYNSFSNVFRAYENGAWVNLIGAGSSVTWGSDVLDGLVLSNNATDADHDIDIASGQATVLTGSVYSRVSLASITKRIDALWVVGTNQGGLDTGTVASSTWYHVFLIHRSDTDVTDVLMSLSASAPTMPTSYDGLRRIGAILTDGSANIIAFSQNGNEFLWKSPIEDVNNETNPGSTAALKTLSVPTGIQVHAEITTQHWSGTGNYTLYMSSPDVDDDVVSTSNAPLGVAQNSTGSRAYWRGRIRTNASAQVRRRFHASDAGLGFDIVTNGWIDPRGKK